MNRALQLQATGDWQDATYARSNAPFGEVLHWTHPLDAYLLFGGAVGRGLGSFDYGLWMAGLLLGPLSHAFAVWAVVRMGKNLWSPDSVVLLVGLFLLQPGVTAYFTAGSVDHHGVLLTLCLWLIVLLWIQFNAPVHWAVGVLTGGLLGLGLWVSTEFLIATAVCVGFLVGSWLWNPSTLTKKWLIVMSALLVLMVLVLPWERPWAAFFREEYDKISIVHLTAVSLLWAFWFVADLLPENYLNQIHKRLGYCVVWGIGMGLTMGLLFPKFFLGPMVDIDPQVMELVWNKVSQVKPLLDSEIPRVGPLVLWLGIGFFAIPYVLWLVWIELHPGNRGFWGLMLLGIIMFVPLTFYQIRWAGYAEIFLIFPYADLLFRLAGSLQKQVWIGPSNVVYGLVVIVGVLWSFFFGLGVIKIEAKEPLPLHRTICPTKALTNFLNDDPQVKDRSQTIATYLFTGPEILYRTKHKVLGTPYHRNRDGIVDEYRLFAETDQHIIHALVKERDVSLFVVCPHSQEERDYYTKGGGGKTFYEKLESGQIPQWLWPVTLPPELSHQFKMYRVVGDRGNLEVQ